MQTRARVAGILILAAALAGCAPAGQAPPTPSTATPAPATAAPASPAPATVTARPVALPWPAATAAQVASLQTAVNGGAQPWLLDPTEVALAYAAARGWQDATAVDTTAAGVTIRSSAGTHVLKLAQPGTTGMTGIWVVTADR